MTDYIVGRTCRMHINVDRNNNFLESKLFNLNLLVLTIPRPIHPLFAVVKHNTFLYFGKTQYVHPTDIWQHSHILKKYVWH